MTGYICNGSMTVEEREKKIQDTVRLYHKGMKPQEIASKLGCDRTTVYKWLKLKHIKVGDGARKHSVDLIAQVAELYQTKTRAEIARILDMDYASVQYIINAYYIRKGEVLA